MEHKKTYCKLRFTCKCHMLNGFKASKFEPEGILGFEIVSWRDALKFKVG